MIAATLVHPKQTKLQLTGAAYPCASSVGLNGKSVCYINAEDFIHQGQTHIFFGISPFRYRHFGQLIKNKVLLEFS